MDGELYSGRGRFEQISATVRSASGNWDGIRLHVFDVPQAQGNLYQRLETASKWAEITPVGTVYGYSASQGARQNSMLWIF